MSQSTETDKLKGRSACPFCGSTSLCIVLWVDDDGEYDAVECNHCKAGAPLDVWDKRSGAGCAPGIILPESESLNQKEAIEAKRFFRRFEGCRFTPSYGIRKP